MAIIGGSVGLMGRDSSSKGPTGAEGVHVPGADPATGETRLRVYRVSLWFPLLGIIVLLLFVYLVAAQQAVMHPLLWSPTPPDKKMTVLLIPLGILLIPGGFYLIVSYRGRVLLDETGIYKKSFRTWRSAYWRDIVSVRARDSDFDIVMKNGTRLRISGYLLRHSRMMRTDLYDYLSRLAPTASMEGFGHDWVELGRGNALTRRRIPPFVHVRVHPWPSIAAGSAVLLLLAVAFAMVVRRVDALKFMGQQVWLRVLGLFLLLGAGIFAVVADLKVKRALRKAHRNMCWTCGYDLRGLPKTGGQCPECGTEVDLDSLHEKWAPLKRFIHRNDDGE